MTSNTTPTDEQILEGVTALLVDALGIEKEEILPTKLLIGDLGAEPIDLLDIVYRADKKFGLKIETENIWKESITPEEFANLQHESYMEKQDEFLRKQTVQDFADFVKKKLQEKQTVART